jgi:hypothetical protein
MVEEVDWCRCFALRYEDSSELDAASFERRFSSKVRASGLVPLDGRVPLKCGFYGVQLVSRETVEYHVLVLFNMEVAVGSKEQLTEVFDIGDGSTLKGNWPHGTESCHHRSYWKFGWLCFVVKGPMLAFQARFVTDVQSCINGQLRGVVQGIGVDGGSPRCVMIGRRFNLEKVFGRQVMQDALRVTDGGLHVCLGFE